MTNVKCTTDLDVTLSHTRYTTSFMWKIRRLKYRPEEHFIDRGRVLSHEFNVEESEGRTTKWMLELLPSNANFSLSGENYLKLLVHNMNAHRINTRLIVYFDVGGTAKEMVDHVKMIKENSSFEMCKHTWKSLNQKKLFGSGGNLTIKCDLMTTCVF